MTDAFNLKKIARRKNRVFDINGCFRYLRHIPKYMLDIGFGNGEISSYYASNGVDVIGFEIQKRTVKEALQKFPKCTFLYYDGKLFPIRDAVFDTIILNDVLEHISYDDIEILLPEIKRVMKIKGIIYISVMNRWQIVEPHKLIPFLTWLPRIFWHPISRRIRGMNYINYWPYTRKRLKRLFERHNLNYVDLTSIYITNKFTGRNPIGGKILSRILSYLNRLGFSKLAYSLALKISVLLYVARKPPRTH